MSYKIDVHLPDGAAVLIQDVTDWEVHEHLDLEVWKGDVTVAYFAPGHWARVHSREVAASPRPFDVTEIGDESLRELLASYLLMSQEWERRFGAQWW